MADKNNELPMDRGRYEHSMDPLVIELMTHRYGLYSVKDLDVVRNIEQEIILAALRIQKRSDIW